MRQFIAVTENEAWRRLALGIVRQAVHDCTSIDKKRGDKSKSAMRFLTSDWCELILESLGFNSLAGINFVRDLPAKPLLKKRIGL